MSTTLRCWILIGLMAGVALGAVDAVGFLSTDDVISDDAGTRRVMLSNGLEVIVVEEADVQGGEQVAAWLVLRAGSMYERDDQRGAASVLERVVRMGTVDYASDAIDGLLMKSALGVGVRAGSFVSFQQSAYLGVFEQGDLAAMEDLFGFFAQVIDHDALVLDEQRFEEAVVGLIDEIKHEPVAELRARQRWLPALMKGTLFGDRLPRPDVEELRALSGQAVRGFAREFYHPGQALLIVYGDVDADTAIGMAQESLGALAGLPARALVDGRIGGAQAMRAVLACEPELERDQFAMIWFHDVDDELDVTGMWSDRRELFTDVSVRELVARRVAREVVRYRLRQQGTKVLGGDVELVVEQVNLWGQLDLMQIVLEQDESDWALSLHFLVREVDRLWRDGAGADEIERARQAALANWHREVDLWGQRPVEQRMGLVHWWVTTGGPVMSYARWDRLASEVMEQVEDREVLEAMRLFIDPRLAAYVGVVAELEDEIAQDGTDWHQQAVLERVGLALSDRLEPIDAGWMERLTGTLLDSSCVGGEVEEVSVYEAASVWEIGLDNGVRLWVRADEEASSGAELEGRIHLTATVWGHAVERVIELGNQQGDLLDGALVAWRVPATLQRGSGAIAAYINEHELRVRAIRNVGYVQLSVDGPAGKEAQAMELMYALMDRPMIEQQAFDDWLAERGEAEVDPVERGLELLISERGLQGRVVDGPTIDAVGRALGQILGQGRIDIGIACVGDGEQVMELAVRYFGSLPLRTDSSYQAGDGRLGLAWDGPSRVEVVDDREAECGVAVGFIEGVGQPLDQKRALILGSILLNTRFEVQAGEWEGIDRLHASVAYSDTVPGRVVFLVRAWCRADAIDDARRLAIEAIESLAHGDDETGSLDEELSAAQRLVVESVGRYFESPRFWSNRLSSLGVYGHQVDDLWNIRQGYLAIDHEGIERVFEAMLAESGFFEVEIVGSD